MGCVLLEAAVWVVHGKTGLQSFRDARWRENEDRKTDAGDCFHDGLRILRVVSAQRESLVQDVRVSDYITGLVLDVVVGMLRPDPGERPAAAVVAKDLEDKICEAETRLKGHDNYETSLEAARKRVTQSPGSLRHRTVHGRLGSMGDPPGSILNQSEPNVGKFYPIAESTEA